MIRLDNIGSQHGHQILFVGASMALNRGEKVGLVGPNGSGKSTLFRYIMKEEQPDEGSISIDRGTSIGWFRQDVGEMKGRSVVEETESGAGQVADVGHEMKELERKLADPAHAEEMEALVSRFGELPPFGLVVHRLHSSRPSQRPEHGRVRCVVTVDAHQHRDLAVPPGGEAVRVGDRNRFDPISCRRRPLQRARRSRRAPAPAEDRSCT